MQGNYARHIFELINTEIMNYKETIQTILSKGGLTVDQYGDSPKTGQVVAIGPLQYVITLDKAISEGAELIRAYMEKNAHHVYKGRHIYFGFWLSKGRIYCDIVINLHDLHIAHELAYLEGQQSYYDLDTDKVIWTGLENR